MNNKNWITIIIAISIVVLSSIFWNISKKRSQKIVYVELEKVYENFTLSKYYNTNVEKYQNACQLVLDSLELEIKMLIQYNSDPILIRKSKDKYFKKRNEFEQNYQLQTNQYSEKVMKQLNQYLEDYGDENQFDYIMIKQLKSQILYANKENDVTNEVITYINKKYQGK